MKWHMMYAEYAKNNLICVISFSYKQSKNVPEIPLCNLIPKSFSVR